MKVGIWFKEKNPDRLICYCSKVTARQIKDVVSGDNKAGTVDEVSKLTNAMKQSNCKINNPSGRCCSKGIQSIIDETLAKI
ncbi:MAG: (2Fe-2S)-binding protein [Ruminiclostridium sp.]|nr:(2Fe-2S)-binding protein [Ruminiclostridium sp.]